MLVQDGAPTMRGLTWAQAEQEAAKRAKKYEGHVGGTSRRVPEYNIKLDTALIAEHDMNYRWWKENK